VRDWLYPYYCGAGRGAQTRYDAIVGRWRKRVFGRLRWVFVGLAVPVLVGAGVAGLGQHPFWTWISGMALGALITVYVAARESPPAYIENWRTGFEGERRTARALAPLRRDGYVLLHDLADRRTHGQHRKGNIDHVVVSPGGVYLLDSKWLGGKASIDGDVIHVQRPDDDEDSYDLPSLARGMRGRALRLQEDIRQQTGVRFVKAVVVFWNEFEAGIVRGDNVVFIHGDHVVDWLEEQAPEMAPDMVAPIAIAIEAVRPAEHRCWWDRLPTLGPHGRDARVLPTSSAVAEDS
jgi:hypothetical protein